MLGQKLSFDGFAMARSIFIQLHDSHRKLDQLVKTDVASHKRYEIT